ncbi:MAG: hypothetical protein IT384_18910 [Deltaproteobacteria bacterium]|nr:hypothetical protein [Deltaproteobacteria bacterium]
MRVVFDGGLLETVGPKETARVLVMLLRALVECNLDYLRKHPRTPHPYEAGIRYEREHGSEIWKSIPKILQDGGGDCEDLSAYLAAYLSFHGVKPVRLAVRWRAITNRSRLYHVLVKGPEGYEDPSKKLGM